MLRVAMLLSAVLSITSAQEWTARYSTGDQNSEEALALAVDPYGCTYVAGYAQGITVVKYSPNGETLWTRTLDDINRRLATLKAATQL